MVASLSAQHIYKLSIQRLINMFAHFIPENVDKFLRRSEVDPLHLVNVFLRAALSW